MNIVDIYSTTVSENLKRLQTLYEFLSESEKKQSHRFITVSLSNAYIVSRSMLRYILAQHLNILPQDIKFKTNNYGKPSVSNSGISFNMSHSEDVIYYAVSNGTDIGIDVEFLQKKRNVIDIAKSVFTDAEFRIFMQLSENETKPFFYEAWTKKEAFIKAIGMGLSYPMNEVDTLQVEYGKHLTLCNEQYYLYKLRSNKNYRAHLVAKSNISKILNRQIYNLRLK